MFYYINTFIIQLVQPLINHLYPLEIKKNIYINLIVFGIQKYRERNNLLRQPKAQIMLY